MSEWHAKVSTVVETPKRKPDFAATIRFLTTDEGGRVGPVITGNCPNHGFGDAHGLVGAYHSYDRAGWIAPGETVKAELWLLAPDVHKESLIEGQSFTVQEASRVVGHGRIEAILNADLIRPPSQ